MTTLIAYGTIEGQTKKIADFVEGIAKDLGQEVTLFNTSDLIGDTDFEGVDKVILAASVHERKHPKDFEVFASGNQELLAERDVMLLSVSLNAAFDEFHEEAKDYADEMILRTGLKPREVHLVAGAVRPESYDYYAAQVLRHVVLRGKDFDATTKAHEFTDWDKLRNCVTGFLKDEG